jgi:hypothetical protein
VVVRIGETILAPFHRFREAKGGDMLRKTALWLFIAMLIVPAFSCTKLQDNSVPAGPALVNEQLPALDSIPTQWGKLVSVTTNPAYPGWFQLWFEDDTSTVRMVAFNHKTNKLDTKVVVIPRR